MKIRGKYLLRRAAGECFLIPVGQTLTEHNHIFRINETGAFLWKHLQQDVSREKLQEALEHEYPDSPASVLAEDIDVFLGILRSKDMLEP